MAQARLDHLVTLVLQALPASPAMQVGPASLAPLALQVREVYLDCRDQVVVDHTGRLDHRDHLASQDETECGATLVRKVRKA